MKLKDRYKLNKEAKVGTESWDAHEAYVEPCEFCGLRSEYCECGEGE